MSRGKLLSLQLLVAVLSLGAWHVFTTVPHLHVGDYWIIRLRG